MMPSRLTGYVVTYNELADYPSLKSIEFVCKYGALLKTQQGNFVIMLKQGEQWEVAEVGKVHFLLGWLQRRGCFKAETRLVKTAVIADGLKLASEYPVIPSEDWSQAKINEKLNEVMVKHRRFS